MGPADESGNGVSPIKWTRVQPVIPHRRTVSPENRPENCVDPVSQQETSDLAHVLEGNSNTRNFRKYRKRILDARFGVCVLVRKKAKGQLWTWLDGKELDKLQIEKWARWTWFTKSTLLRNGEFFFFIRRFSTPTKHVPTKLLLLSGFRGGNVLGGGLELVD